MRRLRGDEVFEDRAHFVLWSGLSARRYANMAIATKTKAVLYRLVPIFSSPYERLGRA